MYKTRRKRSRFDVAITQNQIFIGLFLIRNAADAVEYRSTKLCKFAHKRITNTESKFLAHILFCFR